MVETPLLAVIEKRLQPDGTLRPEITRLHTMPMWLRILNWFCRPCAAGSVKYTASDLHDIDIAIGIDREVVRTLLGNREARNYNAPAQQAERRRINLILTPTRHLMHEVEGDCEGVRV